MSLESEPTREIPCESKFDALGLVQKMETVRLLIETNFLDIGKLLSQAVDGISTLSTALDELAEALSPATIASTTQQLHDASAKISSLPIKQSARRSTINLLETQRDILSSYMENMRRNLSYMRAFTVSIKITAGGISSADNEFSVFAQEMRTRIEAGRTEVDALEHGLCKLKGELQLAVPKTDAVERNCANTIPEVSERLQDAATLLAKHRSKIAAVTADASTLVQNVRKQVVRMLMALQIGDITRQRIEHIQTGIALLESIDLDIPPQDATRVRALLCVLLTAQLDATLNDFNQEIEQITRGLDGLSSDAASLLSLREVAYGKNAGDSMGFLQSLEQRIGVAAGLAIEIEEADALAHDIGNKAATSARVLSDRLDAIQTMKSDVLYMALNTTIKSTRLGDEGRPLGIIATELRLHAGYLEASANTCVLALKNLIDAANDLFLESPEGAIVEEVTVGTALSAAIACIKAAATTTERDTIALAGHGEEVLNLLTRSRGQLDFYLDINDTLAKARDTLRGLAAAAEPCSVDIRAPISTIFKKLAAIYTMAQERDIQTEVIGQWNINIESTSSSDHVIADSIDEYDAELF